MAAVKTPTFCLVLALLAGSGSAIRRTSDLTADSKVAEAIEMAEADEVQGDSRSLLTARVVDGSDEVVVDARSAAADEVAAADEAKQRGFHVRFAGARHAAMRNARKRRNKGYSSSKAYRSHRAKNFVRSSYVSSSSSYVHVPATYYNPETRRTVTRKTIHLLGDIPPPAWPARLGQLHFMTDGENAVTASPDQAGGFEETNTAGSPRTKGGITSTSPGFDIRPVKPSDEEPPELVVPFNTQLEAVNFALPQWLQKRGAGERRNGHCGFTDENKKDKSRATGECTFVDNFDSIVMNRQAQKGADIDVGSSEVDFTVDWEVSLLKFGESMPVIAKHAYIGFGADGARGGKNVILDLGMSFYHCGPNPVKGDSRLQQCDFRGQLNWETEGNWAELVWAPTWPGGPMQKPRGSDRGGNRRSRCPDANHMCDGQKSYSGLVFKEKVAGEEVAEYSGELIGSGGDGDDSFMFLDLDGLKRLGITHAVMTGHEYKGNALRWLKGAFYRLAAGEVTKGSQKVSGSMQTILYQDLDEIREPPSPGNPSGGPAEQNAMMLGMFALRDNAEWTFGPSLPAAVEQDGVHWEFVSLNTPIDGRTIADSKKEILNVLERQLPPVPEEDREALSRQAGLDDDRAVAAELVEQMGADDFYRKFPGGTPGAASRNYYALPESAQYSIRVVKVEGSALDKFKGNDIYVSVYWLAAGKSSKIASSNEATVSQEGVASYDGDAGKIKGTTPAEPFGRFPAELHVWKSTTMWSNTNVGDLNVPVDILPRSVFTDGFFKAEVQVGDPTLMVHLEVTVSKVKW